MPKKLNQKDLTDTAGELLESSRELEENRIVFRRNIPNLRREISIVPETFNKEKRTVDVIWTSGARVFRSGWFSDFWEELDVEGADLTRLNDGAPFLAAHNAGDLGAVLGVVERAWLEKGKGHASVRFSDREEIKPILNDIEDGILRNISVGYNIRAYEKVEEKEGVSVFRVTDWEPFELSVVPAGADNEGKFRAMSQIENKKQNEKRDKPKINNDNQNEPNKVRETMPPEMTDDEKKQAKENENKLRQEGRTAERERQTQIREAVTKAGLPAEYADELIGDATMEIEEARKRVIDKLADKDDEKSGSSIRVQVGENESANHRKLGMENSLLHRCKPGKYNLNDHGRAFAHLSLLEMAREVLHGRNVSTRGMSKHQIAIRALSTSDFPELLANVLEKTLRDAYAEAPRTFDPFTRRVSLSDFKQVTRNQLGDAPELEKVPEGGNATQGQISEAAEKYTLDTYAKKINLTRKMIINDDLSALTRIPEMFGRRARDLESKLVWGVITDNANLADGFALFGSDHKNLASPATAIDVSSVGEGRRAMRVQKGLDGLKLNISPIWLYVPAALETKAEQFAAVNVVPESDANANPFKGRLRVGAESRLDDDSTTAWYLFADTGQLDIIELGTLEGEEGPSIVRRDLGGVQGVEIEIIHDVVAKAIDFRGVYKNPGV